MTQDLVFHAELDEVVDKICFLLVSVVFICPEVDCHQIIQNEKTGAVLPRGSLHALFDALGVVGIIVPVNLQPIFVMLVNEPAASGLTLKYCPPVAV